MAAKQLNIGNRVFDSNGLPAAGAVLKIYTTGTLTPATFYSDSGLSVSLGSSVTANAAGRIVTIPYQNETTPFRLRIEDANGAELDDIDPFYFGQATSFATVATSGLASDLTGTLAAAQLPALTGDATSSAGSAATTLKANLKTRTITFIIDGGGSAITTGTKGVLEIPFDCTITQATLMSDQSGSAVIDIWKDAYANYPPTVGDTITASAKPTLSTATKAQDATLTGWTKAITAGDILKFNVDSASTVTRLTLSLKVTVS